MGESDDEEREMDDPDDNPDDNPDSPARPLPNTPSI